MAVCGRDLRGASGDGDLPWGRDLLTRSLTASETSELSSSDEDSEPDSESSKAGSRSGEADRKSKGACTFNQVREGRFVDGSAAFETGLYVVSMPVGPEMRALFLEVREGCSKTNVARSWCRRRNDRVGC